MRIQIEGREVTVPQGRDLLSTCLDQGVPVPHFCWHRAMGSVGACRLCAVKVHSGADDMNGSLEMACMTQVAEGQRVVVADPEATRFRAQVIEWLMLNHPHDCAVCEEGGECQLQEMTIASGHYLRHAGNEKRTHHNQYLGPLLTHEMNRCIACYRCTRFYRGVAGGHDLDVFGAHDRVYFGRASDGVLESPFAGNLAELCPTGVFNDKGWSKVYARPWDMMETPSVCSHCSVGCNISLSVRTNALRRVVNRQNSAVNGDFLCDRGRYGPLFVESPAMLTAASHQQQPVAIAAALDLAQAALQASASHGGAIGIGSPRASLEANYALKRLVGPNRFFAGMSDSEARLGVRMAELLAAGPARIASLADIASADAALVLGENLTGSAPLAALSLRTMARGAERTLAAEKNVPAFLDNAVRVAGEGRRSPIALITPLPDALDDIATWRLRRRPDSIAGFGEQIAAALRGQPPADAEVAAIAQALADAKAPLVIAGAGLGDIAIVEAAAAIASALGGRAQLALFGSEANTLGLALLGGCGIESALGVAEQVAVIVVENDLLERCDPASVAALLADRTVIALDCIETATTAQADIVMPVASFADAAGTFINHEGRAQRFFAGRPDGPPAAWRVCAALGGGAEPDLDALLASMVTDFPTLAAIVDAAPSARLMTPKGPIARAPTRYSSRTASDRAGRLAQATLPIDVDSPFSWTMEGDEQSTVPAGLFSGAAVLRAGSRSASAAVAAPPPRGEGLRLIPLHDPFSGNETDRASIILAARAPAGQILLHPADAAELGLVAGDLLLADGAPAPKLALDAQVPRGHVAMTSGRREPRFIRIEKRA